MPKTCTPAPDPDWEREKERILANVPGLVQGISGKIGRFVFKTREGKIRVSRLPQRKPRPATPAQAAQMEKFAQASAQAMKLWQDPVQRAYYQELSARKHASARAILMGELLRGQAPRDVGPELERIRQAKAARAEAEKLRREEKRREEENRRHREARRAEARQRAQTPSKRVLTAWHLTVEQILAHIRQLTPAELGLLKANLDQMSST